jgi:hypothetical protein
MYMIYDFEVVTKLILGHLFVHLLPWAFGPHWVL